LTFVRYREVCPANIAIHGGLNNMVDLIAGGAAIHSSVIGLT
jgi:hypothetical protein